MAVFHKRNLIAISCVNKVRVMKFELLSNNCLYYGKLTPTRAACTTRRDVGAFITINNSAHTAPLLLLFRPAVVGGSSGADDWKYKCKISLRVIFTIILCSSSALLECHFHLEQGNRYKIIVAIIPT